MKTVSREELERELNEMAQREVKRVAKRDGVSEDEVWKRVVRSLGVDPDHITQDR